MGETLRGHKSKASENSNISHWGPRPQLLVGESGLVGEGIDLHPQEGPRRPPLSFVNKVITTSVREWPVTDSKTRELKRDRANL